MSHIKHLYSRKNFEISAQNTYDNLEDAYITFEIDMKVRLGIIRPVVIIVQETESCASYLHRCRLIFILNHPKINV